MQVYADFCIFFSCFIYAEIRKFKHCFINENLVNNQDL